MRLFEYDERSLLASIPEMYAFQKVIGCLCAPFLYSDVHSPVALGHLYSLAKQSRTSGQRYIPPRPCSYSPRFAHRETYCARVPRPFFRRTTDCRIRLSHSRDGR